MCEEQHPQHGQLERRGHDDLDILGGGVVVVRRGGRGCGQGGACSKGRKESERRIELTRSHNQSPPPPPPCSRQQAGNWHAETWTLQLSQAGRRPTEKKKKVGKKQKQKKVSQQVLKKKKSSGVPPRHVFRQTHQFRPTFLKKKVIRMILLYRVGSTDPKKKGISPPALVRHT